MVQYLEKTWVGRAMGNETMYWVGLIRTISIFSFVSAEEQFCSLALNFILCTFYCMSSHVGLPLRLTLLYMGTGVYLSPLYSYFPLGSPPQIFLKVVLIFFGTVSVKIFSKAIPNVSIYVYVYIYTAQIP